MRRITTITAGWLWLVAAYLLPVLVGAVSYLAYYTAGCQDTAHAITPSLQGLCAAGGAADTVRWGTLVVLLLIWSGGLILSLVTAIRNLRAPQAWALLATAAIATALAVIVGARAQRLDTFIVLISATAASICILVVGPLGGGVAKYVTHHRERRRDELRETP
ncbi:hypothetical protein AB1K54_15285 [Microbacterium sp. BWT-B31]|uniref:hypothetical protein n=1 Tax=Microbacterium sp. BWT-B31 TaxID=3232072 RepID=UPI0035281B20